MGHGFQGHARRAAFTDSDSPCVEGRPERLDEAPGQPPHNTRPAYEKISLSYSRDERAGVEQLVVKVEGDPEVVRRYVGRDVWVKASGRSFSLGTIQSDGFARCEVDGRVNFADDKLTLTLGTDRKSDNSRLPALLALVRW